MRTKSRSQRRHLQRIANFQSLESRWMLTHGPVISELMAINDSTLMDEDGDFSDWLEVHNATATDIHLNGWYLTDSAANLTKWQIPDVTLADDEYLVFFASGKDRANPFSELHTNYRLDGGGEYLALVHPDGMTVAHEFAPQFPSQSANMSYGLAADETTEGFYDTPTPGAANGSQLVDPSQRVIINELMYHPASNNDLEEYLEVVNRSGMPVDVSGWQIDDGVQFTFPDISIPHNDYLVVAANVDAFQAKYPGITNVVGGWTGRLSNGGERVRVVDDLGRTVDEVTYADQGDWSQRSEGPLDAGHTGWVWLDDHDGGGHSLELANADLTNEEGQNWRASAVLEGTPGVENSVASSDIAPMILDVTHSPVIPRASEPVSVTVRLLDELSVGQTATLHWRVDGAGTFQQYRMYDTGKQGDGAANNGEFGAIIPAHPHGTIIEFYVSGSDSGTLSRSWPAATQPSGQQLANLLYQVDDSYDSTAPWPVGAQPELRLIMTESERAELADIGDGPGAQSLTNAQMNASVVRVDGSEVEVRYSAGIRNRGNSSRVATGNNRNNYRINLSRDRLLDGISSLNINARGVPDQIVGNAIHRLALHPAPDGRPIQLRVNGQNLAVAGDAMYGSYIELEVADSDFAMHHFPNDPDGNVYRVKDRYQVSGGELTYEGTDPNSYRDSYYKQTNESVDDWTDLINMLDVLNNAPDATYLSDLSQVLDVEQWMRYLALDSLLGNLEGGLPTGRGDDFAMYAGVIDPKFVLVPHDMDTLFTPGTETRDIFNNYINVRGLTRLFTHPDTRSLYLQAFRDLIQEVYNPETLNPLIDQLLDFVPSATRDIWKQYIVARTDSVLSQLEQQTTSFTIASHLPVVGEFPRTTLGFGEVHGTSDPIATQSVLVDGQLANYDANTGEWSLGSMIAGQVDTLISEGANWDYLDNGTDQGTAWKETDFVIDANWRNGPAELGYGDNDEATVVSFGPSSTNKYITTYFRHTFNVANPSQYDSGTLRLLRDDGAAVYLNGSEVVRVNLPVGAGHLTLAAPDQIGPPTEQTFFSYNIDPTLLVAGTNVVAVEVHQAALASSDISMNLELTAEVASSGSGFPVNPGVDRIVVQAFDGPGGTGQVVDSGFIDIWRDSGSEQTVSGTISDPSGTVTWTTADGPYHVTANATVPVGQKLVIQPGTSVYFDQDTRLQVSGILDAQGTAFDRIRFTSVPNAPEVPNQPGGQPGLPDGPPRWDGVQFIDSMSAENIISFADFDYAQGSQGSIGVIRSEAIVDNVTWRGTHRPMFYTEDASYTLKNSVFPDMFADGESPAALGLDNTAEQVKGVGSIPAGGRAIIQNNFFGTNRGHNDIIDSDSNRLPNPILQVLDNVFTGAGDELLDLGGDVYVAGNLFASVFKDDQTSDTGYANAISTGDAGANTTVVVSRNVFWEVDHAINLKQSAATIFENNTVHGVHDDFVDVFGDPNIGSAINLFVPEPGAVPGLGAYASGNIFSDVPRVFGNVDLPAGTTSTLELQSNYVDMNIADVSLGDRPHMIWELGAGNVQGDVHFVDAMLGDLQLDTHSGAKGQGPFGQDFGAFVPAGVWIAGEPPTVTGQTAATLTFGGPGIFAFRYRVNGGSWSSVIPIGSGFNPSGSTVRSVDVTLNGLTDGMYTVEAEGQDFAGVWQASPTVSKTWTVETFSPQVLINEVLADNDGVVDHQGTQPDLIELVNLGANAIDLGGMRISDNPTVPDRFQFAPGTIVQPGDYLTLYANAPDGTPGIHLGFSLNDQGDGVYLFDSVGSGGNLLDSVDFGLQVPNLSIGRQESGDNPWTLTVPTFGSANVVQPTSDWSAVRLNEWLARGDELLRDDFLEIYNPTSLPIPLGGLFFSDEPVGWPTMHPIPSLSFLAANGYRDFIADGDAAAGHDHLSFRLSSNQEMVALLDPGGNVVDSVIFVGQVADRSQGRSPNGSSTIVDLQFPTPGAANENPTTTSVQILIQVDDVWSYDDSGTDLGTAWRQPAFNDASWPTGPGVLGTDPDTLPAPIQTPISLGIISSYYRRHFNLTTDPATTHVEILPLVDDGAVIYVNGMEVTRLGLPGGTVNYLTGANRTITIANYEGPVTVPSAFLNTGDNVIAVELHQNDTMTSDAVFGLIMTAESVVSDTSTQEALDLLNGLRITELMYHPFNVGSLEFFELQNVGAVALDLSGVRMAEGVEFEFPSSMLAPGEVILVVQDQMAFESLYGTGLNVAGEYGTGTQRFSFSNGGETVRLVDSLGRTVQQFSYDDQAAWPIRADGHGSSLEIIDVNGNVDDPSNWRASVEFHGSPGVTGVGSMASVVINEVLTDSESGNIDFVELYNPTGSSVMTTQWYLSDDQANYFKFQIGPSLISANQYMVLDESFLGFSFSNGMPVDLWLIEADGSGQPLRFVDHFSFTASPQGESVGRWPNGTGEPSPLASQTPFALNSGPRVGPLVVTEVHYHPADPGNGIDEDLMEFVEIFNPDLGTIDLSGWEIEGLDAVIPAGTMLGPGQVLVVLPFDPYSDLDSLADFESVVGVDVSSSSAHFVGGYSGLMDDHGEPLELRRAGSLLTGELVTEDQVFFDDESPWPTLPAGGGSSLHRVSTQFWGGNYNSWYGAAPTPGSTIPVMSGDISQNLALDATDIDLVYANLGSTDPLFDLDGDMDADRDDVVELVQNVMKKEFGDVDLDGDVDILDFNKLVVQFNPLGGGEQLRWQNGNFDGDTDIDITDFSHVVRNFSPLGYVLGVMSAVTENEPRSGAGLISDMGSPRMLPVAFAQDAETDSMSNRRQWMISETERNDVAQTAGDFVVRPQNQATAANESWMTVRASRRKSRVELDSPDEPGNQR